MTRVIVDHGICGFISSLTAEKNADYTVTVSVESTCPNLSAIPAETLTFDPVMEMTSAGTAHVKLAKYIPHRSCLFTAALLKAAETEAGYALKKNAGISFAE